MLAPSNTVDLLQRSYRSIIDRNKWCKGTRDDGRGRHCAMGALNLAGLSDDENESSHPAVIALNTAARELYPEITYSTCGDNLSRVEDPTCGYYCLVYRIVAVNNQLGHDATLRMFERAIELAALASA